MEKQEIIERCIKAYTEAINECSELNLQTATDWLLSKSLECGVCRFVISRLNYDVAGKYWIQRNIKKGLYWAEVPILCETHSELMESLKTRLEILKKESLIPEE